MEVRIAREQNERDDVFQIRKAVFVDEQGVPAEHEYDEFEEEAEHVVIYDESHQPIAAGRWRIVDDAAKLERICVIASHRKHGLGKVVVEALEKQAKARGIAKAKLNGQTHALHFYEKLGYRAVSEVFMEEGIPHVAMVKELKGNA